MTIRKLCRLSNLHLDEKEHQELVNDLQMILGFVDIIHSVDTDNVQPLAHPLEMVQVLREDTPAEAIERDVYQELSKGTQDGFYLVPRVIEP